MDCITQKKKRRGKLLWSTRLIPITITPIPRVVVIQPSNTEIILIISMMDICIKSMKTMWMNVHSTLHPKILQPAPQVIAVGDTMEVISTGIHADTKKFPMGIILIIWWEGIFIIPMEITVMITEKY
jgi:hypothetical protein